MVMSGQLTHPGMAPFRIAPRFVGRVWGYRDLRPWYDWVAEGGDPIGEVWLTGDDCLVATGPMPERIIAAFTKASIQGSPSKKW